MFQIFLISDQSYLQAFLLCKDIDEKDTPYIALAIEFGIEVITKDDELVEGLRAKGFQQIVSLREFLRQVSSS